MPPGEPRKNANKNRHNFGGTMIDFSGQTITLEALYGPFSMGPGQGYGRLWAYAKSNGLVKKLTPPKPDRIRARGYDPEGVAYIEKISAEKAARLVNRENAQVQKPA